jgi:hypothetical protein
MPFTNPPHPEVRTTGLDPVGASKDATPPLQSMPQRYSHDK